MRVNLQRLARTADTVALKLRAAGEQCWQPVVEALAARLWAGDASAAAELLDAIERPGGLAELEISPDNAQYVTDADAATVSRQIRGLVNHLNLLAGLAVPGSRWHEAGDERAGTEKAGESGGDDDCGDDDEGLYALSDEPPDARPEDGLPAYTYEGDPRTLEERIGFGSREIDWFRVILHGLCGIVAGSFIAATYWMNFSRRGLQPPASLAVFVLVGAIAGGLLGVFGFWDWLRGE